MLSCLSEILNPSEIVILFDIILLRDNFNIVLVFIFALLNLKRYKILNCKTKEELKELFEALKFENLEVNKIINKFLFEI
jgi:hypothetical protein